jgi:ethanolamine ammonia-lyase small subunit
VGAFKKGNGEIPKSPYVTVDPWEKLKEYTDARISLGRSGVSLPLREWLKFNLDHALAKDAVMLDFDHNGIASELQKYQIRSISLESQARDKDEYLRRPDLGRLLNQESVKILEESIAKEADLYEGADAVIVICDGLSARAINTSALEVTVKFLKLLKLHSLKAAPVVIVTRGRVAAADHVNDYVKAKLVVNLIGERPGLSSPDSMGAYITYGAFKGILEESRNCISNIRPAGLKVDEAVKKLSYIVQKAFAMKITGTSLKDDMPDNYLPFDIIPALAGES